MSTTRTLVTALCACAALGSGAAQAADVGVSVQVSQPGVYGRIDIGRFPQPAVIVPQPVIIAQPAVVVAQPPAYLWVPPGHRKNWAKHCHKYDACGVPVYFVRHDWYDSHVRPVRVDAGPGLAVSGYPGPVSDPDRHGNGRGRGHGHGHGRD